MPRRQAFRFPAAAIGIGALLAAAGAAAIDWIPIQLAGVYFILSGVSYVMYRSDKLAATRGARRTQESSLHLADLLGGWPGALVAQQRFRHKTVKASFRFVFWITVVVNVAGVWWLVDSVGHAESAVHSAAGEHGVPGVVQMEVE